MTQERNVRADAVAIETSRSLVARELAKIVCRRDLGHPVRVAIDGVTASGKSTLAGEVTQAVMELGHPAIRLTMDGFHHLRERRYRLGRLSAEGYYNDAYNFAAFARHVLVPLGPGGDRRYRSKIMNLATDERIDEPPVEAPRDAVVVVDGTFLQRPEMVEHWDHRIFVDTSLAVARTRGTHRDAEQLGGLTQAEHIYDSRYHAAARIYLDRVRPAGLATALLDNNDLTHPRLYVRDAAKT